MALNYTYKKYKDVYSIQNTGIVALNYTIDVKNCNELSRYKKGIININSTLTVPITFTDSIYAITLSDGVENILFNDIIQYDKTLEYTIRNIEQILCGCSTCPCKDSETECDLRLNTLVACLSLTSIYSPKYSNYLSVINDYLKCTTSNDLSKYCYHFQVTGKQNSEDLFLQIIGLYYLTFCYTDLYQAVDDEERAYIKTKYKYNKISSCLRKIGINIADMESISLDYPVHYWQLSNINDGISDVLPLLNEAYLATKPVDTFKVFNQGKTVSCTSIGPIVFTIKNADSENFILMDSLGNDITDQFDTNYNPTTRYALFVSKIFYSYSDIYFKFKQQNILQDKE